jgi:hypothetical protein
MKIEIIGKKWRIIKALRDIIKLMATKEQRMLMWLGTRTTTLVTE